MFHVVWSLMTFEFLTVFSVALIIGIWAAYYAPKRHNLKGKHIMVTGGSSGIGKQLAIEAVKIGADVSIIARNPALLEEARSEILAHAVSSNQKVVCVSLDVGGMYQNVQKAVSQAEEELGPVYFLACNAGFAKSGKFEDLPIDQFKRMMDVNYLGAVQVAHCVVGGMKGRREGKILFVSSQAGLGGVFGFTAYTATKFALRGMAEAMAMELKPYNVTVTVSFPPDTDTPGFVKENKDKPEETRLISEAGGLHKADDVGYACLHDALNGKFLSTVGFEGFIQATLCAGMSPVTSWFDLAVQVLTMGLFRLVSVFYLIKFDNIVRRCMDERNQRKRSE